MGPKGIINSALLVLCVFFSAHTVLASISEGFISDVDFDEGTIVSSDATRSGFVVKANTSNIDNVIGVATGEEGALISTGSEDSNVDIVTTGEAFVLVSNLNGPIGVGDGITVSSVSGVGMKALSRIKVVGIAQEEFSGGGDNTQLINITDETGEERVVSVGIIRSRIDVHEYTPETESGNPFFVALQDAAQSVTGQPVTLARTLISGGVMISTLIVVVMVLMGATQGTMISLGRNPLAKRTIFSTMVKFVLVSVTIFAGGIIAAYLILVS